MEWQPIETAPNGKQTNLHLGVSWMRLAWVDGNGEWITADGMRVGDDFYAACSFHIGGKKRFEFREVKVNPIHWMPLPDQPQ